MEENFVIVPSSGPSFDALSDVPVELARNTSGKLYRKHILNKGELIHPVTGEKINVDDAFIETMKKNFDNKVCDIVQVPLANDKNEHSEAPDRNIGEVVDIEARDGKVYAIIDARDEILSPKLGKTLLGASAMMSLNYTNTSTGEKVGPTLLHTCVTNRPYITNLDDYEEIVAASADKSEDAVILTEVQSSNEDDNKKELTSDDDQEITGLDEETENMTKEDMLKALKEEHGIDVDALTEQAGKANDATALSNAIVDALKKSDVVSLTNSDSVADVTKAVTDLASEKVALSNRVDSLEKDAASAQVDKLISDGYILPAKKDTMVTLKLSNSSLFDELLPSEPIVKMSNESGVAPADIKPELDIDKEVARFSEMLGK